MCRDMKVYENRKKRKVCVQCGCDISHTNKTYCDFCKNKIKIAMNELRESRNASGRCIKCGDILTDKDRFKNGKPKKQCSYCRQQKKQLRLERGWK